MGEKAAAPVERAIRARADSFMIVVKGVEIVVMERKEHDGIRLDAIQTLDTRGWRA